MSGLFITLEGTDGCGKSTQAEMLAARLREQGVDVVELREPGGTLVGERLRAVLADPDHEGIEPWTEVFLFEASRAELVAKHVRPALEAGRVVVCDRFADSTLAYQGYGRGIGLDVLRTMNDAATGGLEPDVTLVIDVSPEVAGGRVGARAAEGPADRPADRLDAEEEGFRTRVREGFLSIARDEPDRVLVVDGSGPPDEVAAGVWRALSTHRAAVASLSTEG